MLEGASLDESSLKLSSELVKSKEEAHDDVSECRRSKSKVP